MRYPYLFLFLWTATATIAAPASNETRFHHDPLTDVTFNGWFYNKDSNPDVDFWLGILMAKPFNQSNQDILIQLGASNRTLTRGWMGVSFGLSERNRLTLAAWRVISARDKTQIGEVRTSARFIDQDTYREEWQEVVFPTDDQRNISVTPIAGATFFNGTHVVSTMHCADCLKVIWANFTNEAPQDDSGFHWIFLHWVWNNRQIDASDDQDAILMYPMLNNDAADDGRHGDVKLRLEDCLVDIDNFTAIVNSLTAGTGQTTASTSSASEDLTISTTVTDWIPTIIIISHSSTPGPTADTKTETTTTTKESVSGTTVTITQSPPPGPTTETETETETEITTTTHESVSATTVTVTQSPSPEPTTIITSVTVTTEKTKTHKKTKTTTATLTPSSSSTAGLSTITVTWSPTETSTSSSSMPPPSSSPTPSPTPGGASQGDEISRMREIIIGIGCAMAACLALAAFYILYKRNEKRKGADIRRREDVFAHQVELQNLQAVHDQDGGRGAGATGGPCRGCGHQDLAKHTPTPSIPSYDQVPMI